MGDYRLVLRPTSFNGGDYTDTYYPGVADPADQELLHVAAGRTTVVQDFDPLPGGHIKGQVVRPDGQPFETGSAVAYARGDDGEWVADGGTEIQPDGSYDIGQLGPGPRRVGVSVRIGSSERRQPFAYTHLGDTTSIDDPGTVDVDVAVGQTTAVGPIHLVPNGTAAGIVLDPDDQPVAGAKVRVSRDRDVLETTTDSAGRWDGGPLVAGEYRVTVSDPSQLFTQESSSLSTTPRAASSVTTRLNHERPLLTKSPTLDYPGFAPWDATVTVSVPPFVQPDAKATSITWYAGYIGYPEDAGEAPRVLARGPSYTLPGRKADGRMYHVVITFERHGIRGSATVGSGEARDPQYFLGTPRLSTARPAVHEMVVASTEPPDPTLARISWRWYRDGKVIPGATGSRYRATTADLGRKLSAEAKLERPTEHPPLYTRTPAHTVVRAVAAPRVTFTPRGSRKVAVIGTISTGRVSAAYADGRLVVYRSRPGSDRIGTVRVRDGKVRASLTGQPRGRHTYWVRFVDPDGSVAPGTSRRMTVTVR